MKQLAGTYYKGKIRLNKILPTKRPLKVIVSFIDDIENDSVELKLSDFSFQKSRELLKNLKGSLSEALLDERREAL